MDFSEDKMNFRYKTESSLAFEDPPTGSCSRLPKWPTFHLARAFLNYIEKLRLCAKLGTYTSCED